jgi:multiple sugar transport system ATP-binding protein
MSHVSIRKVDIAFGSVPVLDQLDLEVEPGEFVVLLGPSGCGKSTLLNAIAGLLDVNRGQIWIGGRNVTWMEPKDRGIAMVFQTYALYPQMTVRENMAFGLKIAGLSRPEIESRVKEAAAILQLDALMTRKPAELSGGQRQRVAIGRALVREAGVFLFDEPLSNLDAQLRNELRVEIKRLHQRLGATMVYVTHDQIEALTLADRIAVMKDRRIQQFSTPEKLYLQPANRFVAGFVGSPAMNFQTGAIERADGGMRFRSGGFELPVAATAQSETEVELGIRPEHILVDDGGGDMPATVEMVEPMGAETLVWTSVAGLPFSVRVDQRRRLSVGQKIGLRFPSEAIHLFDRKTGARL